MMLARMSVIWGGVCERHPKIRIAFLESGGGWIARWLDRMDRHFDDQGLNDSGLKTRLSDLFQRNCWISFESVEGSLRVLADYIGPHKILWAADYPHRDGFFLGAPAMMAAARLKGMSNEMRWGSTACTEPPIALPASRAVQAMLLSIQVVEITLPFHIGHAFVAALCIIGQAIVVAAAFAVRHVPVPALFVAAEMPELHV
jgi:Amidohydrolase